MGTISGYNATTAEIKEFAVNEYGQIQTTNGGTDIALGNIAGIEQFGKFGTNLNIDTGTTPEDIWNGGGLYTGFPTGSAETMEIRSSDSDDTSAGTGARTVKITNLLDGNYNEMPDITITLNGTSWVSLGAQTYLRASRVVVLTAGSGESNAGTITLRHTTTTANIFAKMPAGKNQTTIMAFTVPAGKTALLNRIFLSMGRLSGAPGSANVNLRVRPLGGVFNATKDASITSSVPYAFENNGYIVVEEKSDVTVRVEDVSDNNTFASCEITGYLKTN